MPKKTYGFSLIELLVVMAIAGVLAAIAFPVYRNYMIKAKIASAFKVLQSFTQQAELYYTRRANFPTSVSNLGYTNGGVVNPSNGYGTAAFNNSVIGETGLYGGNNCATVNSALVGPCTWVIINSAVLGTGTPGLLGMYLTVGTNGVLKWTCYTIPTQQIPAAYLPAGCITTQ